MSTTITNNETMVCDTSEKNEIYRLLSLKMCLKLESVGLRSSRGSVANTVRQLIGSKTRDKKTLLAEYSNWIAVQYQGA